LAVPRKGPKEPAINWTIVTGIVAVYGAVVSTWNAVTKHLENKSRIKAKITFGWPTLGPELGPDSIVITAFNVGQQTTTLVAGGLRLPDNSTTQHFEPWGNVKFPHQLQRGQSCFMIVPKQSVAESLIGAGFSGTVQVKGFYRDALDKTYIGEPVEVKIEEWLKEAF
jgi:hypothetical protein